MANFAAQTSKFCNFPVCNLFFASDLVSSAALLQTFLIREIPTEEVMGLLVRDQEDRLKVDRGRATANELVDDMVVVMRERGAKMILLGIKASCS